MSDSARGDRPDRRRFLKLMGLAGMVPALPRPFLARADSPTGLPPPAAGTSPAADTTATATPAARKPPSAEAAALAEVVKLRYGARLTEDQLRSITEDLDGQVDRGRKLHALVLANGDEPDFQFHV